MYSSSLAAGMQELNKPGSSGWKIKEDDNSGFGNLSQLFGNANPTPYQQSWDEVR